MNTAHITHTANQIVDGFDSTARTVIEAWQAGGERIGDFAGASWDAAFAKSSAQLDSETRKNAQHARKVIGGYYTRGVRLSASGAEVAVGTVVQAARVAIDRAATWQRGRA